MSISQRIFNTVENWQATWKDRLRGWMASWLLTGIENTFDDLESEIKEQLKTTLEIIEASPATPPEYKALLAKMRETTSYAWFIPILIGVGSMIFGMLTAQMTPTLSGIRYSFSRIAEMFRFDPMSIITAWHRDPEKYAPLFDDLKDQGWSDERIEALKFFTLFYPAPADLIRWQAREVFEPTMIERYGLDSEFEAIEKEPFYKAGMTDEQILNYWRAHWEHASWMQVVEMLHRGLLTEKEVYDWFRLVEIPPFWRDLLIKTAYTWPTRVDVRRWWDMRTIDETELRRLYSGMGYRGINLDNYMKWTKVYVDFPMMMTRFRNGWITEEDIRNWLRGLEIPEDRITQFIEEKTKPEKPERVASERDLTAADIIAGVKKEVINYGQGVELLMDLGYDREEAEFKLDVRLAAAAGSPETFEEFKQLTQKWRIAAGREAKPMTEELKKAAEEVVRVTQEIEALTQSIEQEQRGLVEEEVLPAAVTRRLKKLQVSLHRAEAELSRVKSEYDKLLAEWRHGV